MSTFSHETAPTEFVKSNGIQFAYRRFGKRGRRPLVFLQYLTAGLDDWDPLVTNGLALDHDVVLVNNVGVASSSGETPNTIDQMAKDISGFCDGMGFKEIDVVGFSIGGMIAQQLALFRPNLLHRIILTHQTKNSHYSRQQRLSCSADKRAPLGPTFTGGSFGGFPRFKSRSPIPAHKLVSQNRRFIPQGLKLKGSRSRKMKRLKIKESKHVKPIAKTIESAASQIK